MIEIKKCNAGNSPWNYHVITFDKQTTHPTKTKEEAMSYAEGYRAGYRDAFMGVGHNALLDALTIKEEPR